MHDSKHALVGLICVRVCALGFGLVWFSSSLNKRSDLPPSPDTQLPVAQMNINMNICVEGTFLCMFL